MERAVMLNIARTKIHVCNRSSGFRRQSVHLSVVSAHTATSDYLVLSMSTVTNSKNQGDAQPTVPPTSTSSPTSTLLFLIDCQTDFHPGGSLEIPSADLAAGRIAALIRDHGHSIQRIVATLDTHHKLHIAHPSFWIKCLPSSIMNDITDPLATNEVVFEHPPPFTQISCQDILQGVWRVRPDITLPVDWTGVLDATVFDGAEQVYHPVTRHIDLQKFVVEYAQRLEAKGRFKIVIWPEHCLLGSKGHTMTLPIHESLSEWSERTGRSVEWVPKGLHLLTEMYSVFEAEVPVSPETSFNVALHESILTADRILVAGQAKSHCVNYTVRDLVSHFPATRGVSDVILLTDCTSAVPGFEQAADDFEEDMKAAGVQLMKASDLVTNRLVLD